MVGLGRTGGFDWRSATLFGLLGPDDDRRSGIDDRGVSEAEPRRNQAWHFPVVEPAETRFCPQWMKRPIESRYTVLLGIPH
jgi:hypothetical protein